MVMYYHRVYVHNKKQTKNIYWKCKTKNESTKKFRKLRDSDIWDCIVVDDITEQEYKNKN